jgi:hypothetical protein
LQNAALYAGWRRGANVFWLKPSQIVDEIETPARRLTTFTYFALSAPPRLELSEGVQGAPAYFRINFP